MSSTALPEYHTLPRGQFTRLESAMLLRALRNLRLSIHVQLGHSPSPEGRVLRLVTRKGRAGAFEGYTLRLEQVGPEQTTVLAEQPVARHSEYQHWRRNRVGSLGAVVEYSGPLDVARAVLALGVR